MRSGGESRKRGLLAVHVAQHLFRALAAASAARAHPELRAELLERAGAIAGAFSYGLLSNRVAEADVHAVILFNEKHYHLI
jgi:hypothetical protein